LQKRSKNHEGLYGNWYGVLDVNSGRNTQKGDASWKTFVVDFKEVGKSFTLNKEVWAKATTDAMKNGKDPAIVVVIGEGNAKVRLAIIEMSILEDMMEE